MNETHPRALLEKEFARRTARNPRYSLRGFARSLGISHSLLSQVLSGKRRFSRALLERMHTQLDLEHEERAYLQRLTQSDLPLGAETVRGEFEKISLDQFSYIADWYHYAILSLLEIPEARLTAKWVSGRLGISPSEASFAIARLKRLGLIAKVEGRWRQTGGPIKLDNRETTSATRRHHRQLLERAAESLENDPFDTRDLSAVTFAMHPKHVGWARERIKQFRWRLMKELEAFGEPTEVYSVAVQIFPLSRRKP